MAKSYKITHLPTAVGGNPQGISRHLNKICGLKSKTIELEKNKYGYQSDEIVYGVNDGLIKKEIKKFFAIKYVLGCDIVFFNYGRSLFAPTPGVSVVVSGPLVSKVLLIIYNLYQLAMQRLELSMLRLLRKRIFVQYQGDDARQGDFTQEKFEINIASAAGPLYYNAVSDRLKRNQIKLFDRYAEKIYALNPDLLHCLSERAEFLPYSHIDLSDWTPIYTQLEKRKLRIGHAPSHRGVKGTDLVIKAVNNINKHGSVLDFVLIENLSNEEARAVYETVDVVVDQLFAGWYGALAVEAMALGKPVVCYVRESDLVFLPEAMRLELPIIRADPSNIEDVLRWLVSLSREGLYDVARRSRQYVEKWHDPDIIAQRIFKDIIKN